MPFARMGLLGQARIRQALVGLVRALGRPSLGSPWAGFPDALNGRIRKDMAEPTPPQKPRRRSGSNKRRNTRLRGWRPTPDEDVLVDKIMTSLSCNFSELARHRIIGTPLGRRMGLAPADRALIGQLLAEIGSLKTEYDRLNGLLGNHGGLFNQLQHKVNINDNNLPRLEPVLTDVVLQLAELYHEIKDRDRDFLEIRLPLMQALGREPRRTEDPDGQSPDTKG